MLYYAFDFSYFHQEKAIIDIFHLITWGLDRFEAESATPYMLHDLTIKSIIATIARRTDEGFDSAAAAILSLYC